jgi:spore coat polysaccharide biosynthesis protein SpsF
MNPYTTEQEAFWAGEFGNNYVARNQDQELLTSNLALFAHVLARAEKVNSVIEFGPNIGMNLRALQQLLPTADFAAVEINETAATELRKLPRLTVHNQSLLEFRPQSKFDFVLIKGVLIHLQPERLPDVYQVLYESSQRYVCLVEYYNPTPVSISYRGHENQLFKRDFAGEMLKQFPDLKLRDYGFAYHGDANFPGDDVTWFLLEKRKA